MFLSTNEVECKGRVETEAESLPIIPKTELTPIRGPLTSYERRRLSSLEKKFKELLRADIGEDKLVIKIQKRACLKN